MQVPVQTIPQALSGLRSQGHIRQRDAAQRLNLSEGELVAAHVDASAFWQAITFSKKLSDDRQADLHSVNFTESAMASTLLALRLSSQWHSIIASLEPVGEVMALTRNASCVHEKIGVYRSTTLVDQTGVVATESIDLRAFYTRWAHGFAVCEMTARGQRNSLQFYDASGAAIHKIYLCEQSYIQAYESIVKNFAHPLQQPGLYIETPVSRHPEQPDAQVDVEGLHRSWDLLKDTHEFYGLLKDYQVSRVQALRLAQPKYVQQIHRADILRVLTAVAAQEISIMVFVGNPGMLQIHSGPINQVSLSRPWLNVTDASFNLHLRMDHVDSAWLVKKPTVDGLVTSLELFDAQGEVIAMLFGSRKPGQKELESWRELLNTIQETQKYFSA